MTNVAAKPDRLESIRTAYKPIVPCKCELSHCGLCSVTFLLAHIDALRRDQAAIVRDMGADLQKVGAERDAALESARQANIRHSEEYSRLERVCQLFTDEELSRHAAHELVEQLQSRSAEAEYKRDEWKRLYESTDKSLDEFYDRAAEAEAWCAVMMEAAQAFESDLSPDCDGDTRDALRKVLQSAPESARKLLAVVEAVRNWRNIHGPTDPTKNSSAIIRIAKAVEALAALSEPRATED